MNTLRVLGAALVIACCGVGCDSEPECCPRVKEPVGGCLQLGGSNADGYTCGPTCDFWCSTNWRVEVDENGCEVWEYDERAPKAGEDFMCRPLRDAAIVEDDGGLER